MTRQIYDPKDTTGRGKQIEASVVEKLNEAAEARAKAGPTADEKALAKSIEGLTVSVPKPNHD